MLASSRGPRSGAGFTGGPWPSPTNRGKRPTKRGGRGPPGERRAGCPHPAEPAAARGLRKGHAPPLHAMASARPGGTWEPPHHFPNNNTGPGAPKHVRAPGPFDAKEAVWLRNKREKMPHGRQNKNSTLISCDSTCYFWCSGTFGIRTFVFSPHHQLGWFPYSLKEISIMVRLSTKVYAKSTKASN